MRKTHKLLWVSAAVLILAAAGYGQNRFQIGLAFEPFFPQGEFHENMDQIGWGGSLDFLYRIPDSAVHVGAAFAYHVYGWQTRWEPLSWTIPDVLVKVSTTNAVVNSHALLRLQPRMGPARPYIEGLIGMQHLTTDTRVYDDSNWEHESFASTNQIRSTVFSYGLGGGLLLNLSRNKPSGEKSAFTVNLEVGVRYIRGGSANYMKPGDIQLEDGGVTYTINRSRTDILMPKIGVAFAF
jgi:opacity protein-like surface antigen